MFYKNLLELKQTKNGLGVFLTSSIPLNQLVCEFQGDLFNKDTLNRANPYYIQVGKNIYIGPSGSVDDYINHSCNPNCKVRIVGKRAFLHTIKPLAAGSEITFDYSTTTNDDEVEWSMKCNCGSFACRKIIKGYQYLPDDVKQKYLDLGAVPLYLKNA